MIIGIGTDIIEIERIKKAVSEGVSFKEKAFTSGEINSVKGIMQYSNLAGYFAAKEAFAKALGTGFRGFGLKDVEIYKDDLGKPNVRVSGKAEALCEQRKVMNIHVSISHNNENAVAFVILEGK
ncbi:holo-ACP synthase [Clostridium polynesiense]|uniref:holo-ACP synthase n=1 Tax=Clostridium polynesiense TaxID=1325933 RepID=UPI00058AF821|nr:holo-ACP synthase [Clostridium polynesiense]